MLYEMLLRMQTASGEIVSPGEFIEFASSEQLKAIDKLVFTAVLEQQRTTQAIHAVNLSGHTLNDVTFPAWVAQELKRTGANPRLTWVEVVEDVLLEPIAANTIAALRDLRLKTGVDDFGKNNADVRAILLIKPEFIKVDRSLVIELRSSELSEAIVLGVMQGAHRLRIPIVLECIENGAIETKALEMAEGFPGLKLYVQGWLYGRPESCLD